MDQHDKQIGGADVGRTRMFVGYGGEDYVGQTRHGTE
jgi:hypothetical protein